MSYYYPEAVTLSPNGVLTTFTLPSTPASGASFLLLWNGQVQRDSYTLANTTLTTNFGLAVPASDSLVAYYPTEAPTPIPVPSTGPTGFEPELIANAILILLSQANFPFVSIDRRGHVPQNFPIANQPYMGVIDSGGQVVQNQVQGLEKWHLFFTVLVYLRTDATTASIRGTQLNAALKAIENVMRPSPIFGKQTLGGLCVHACIEGNILQDGGIEDEQCVMIIPIKVLTGR